MPWQLVVTKPAEKDLGKLQAKEGEAVRHAIQEMAANPGSADLTKLVGSENDWRLRVGSWRVILRFDNPTGTMYVMRVLPRSRAYR